MGCGRGRRLHPLLESRFARSLPEIPTQAGTQQDTERDFHGRGVRPERGVADVNGLKALECTLEVRDAEVESGKNETSLGALRITLSSALKTVVWSGWSSEQ